MAEISQLLNDLSKQFTIKINEIYENKLEEHKMNISYNLDSGYTKDYGKLDISKFGSDFKNILETVDNYFKKNDNSRYIIHVVSFSENNNTSGYHHQYKSFNYIIDNYGSCGQIQTSPHCYHDNLIENIKHWCSNSKKYILPNILISFIKSLNNIAMRSLLESLQLVSEDYYNRFTHNYNFNQLEELNKQYFKQIEQLIEENIKIKDLQTQLEDSKNQIIKLENEKEEILNKYKETQSKTKAFLGFLGL
jgi:hypothetical protein